MEEQITLSPIASGGGGTFFEQHVDAAFLVFLLVGAVPPFLQGSQLEEVHLQAGHLGWKTDDLLAVSRSSDGSVRKAAIQSKRSFTLTPTDPDCVDTFSKAWQDFSNQNLFEKGRDVLVLIVGAASAKMLAGLRTLLDCTRATLTAADCLRRLQIPKYLGKTPLEYWNTIRAIISKPEGRDIPDDELWNFLRHFDFSSVDLNTSESSTEALLRALLAATATGGASNNTALQTWQALIVLVSGQASRAESITYNKLPEAVRTAHRRLSTGEETFFRRMHEHSMPVVKDARLEIGGVHISRATLVDSLLHQLEEHQIILVVGEAGSGKSALTREAYEAITAKAYRNGLSYSKHQP